MKGSKNEWEPPIVLIADPNLCPGGNLDLFILVAQTTHAPTASSYNGDACRLKNKNLRDWRKGNRKRKTGRSESENLKDWGTKKFLLENEEIETKD
jgi:hypothetical protein